MHPTNRGERGKNFRWSHYFLCRTSIFLPLYFLMCSNEFLGKNIKKKVHAGVPNTLEEPRKFLHKRAQTNFQGTEDLRMKKERRRP